MLYRWCHQFARLTELNKMQICIAWQADAYHVVITISQVMWSSAGLWDFTCELLSDRNETTRGVGFHFPSL